MRRLALVLLLIASVLAGASTASAQFQWPDDNWTVLDPGEFVQAFISDSTPVTQYRIALDDDPEMLAISYLATDSLLRVMHEMDSRSSGGGGHDGLLDHDAQVQLYNAHEFAEFRFAIMQPYSHVNAAYTLGVAVYEHDALPQLEHDAPLTGSLDAQMPIAVYRFSGHAGDILHLAGADDNLHSLLEVLPAYNIYAASYAPVEVAAHTYALRVDGDYALVLWGDYTITPELNPTGAATTWNLLHLTEAANSAEVNMAMPSGAACLGINGRAGFTVTAFQGQETVLDVQVKTASGPMTFRLPNYDGPLRLQATTDQFFSNWLVPEHMMATVGDLLVEQGVPEPPLANDVVVSLGPCP